MMRTTFVFIFHEPGIGSMSCSARVSATPGEGSGETRRLTHRWIGTSPPETEKTDTDAANGNEGAMMSSSSSGSGSGALSMAFLLGIAGCVIARYQQASRNVIPRA